VVTHHLQLERGTVKVRRPETNFLPLCNATNPTKRISVSVFREVCSICGLHVRFHDYKALAGDELDAARVSETGSLDRLLTGARCERATAGGDVLVVPVAVPTSAVVHRATTHQAVSLNGRSRSLGVPSLADSMSQGKEGPAAAEITVQCIHDSCRSSNTVCRRSVVEI